MVRSPSSVSFMSAIAALGGSAVLIAACDPGGALCCCTKGAGMGEHGEDEASVGKPRARGEPALAGVRADLSRVADGGGPSDPESDPRS